MSDETTNNGPEGEAPAPPPLRAVFMVWPGQVHGQTWMFLWLGVTYLLGSLLPWHGANDVQYVLAKPYQIQAEGENSPARYTSQMSAVHYKMAQDQVAAGVNGVQDPGPVMAVRDPAKPFGQTLILLCAIAMVVSAVLNIWNRRLTMTPTLCTWFIALAVLYFTTGSDYVHADTEGGHVPVGWAIQNGSVKGFSQMGDTLGAVFGNFATVIDGKANEEMMAVFNRFGMGYYLTMLAELFLIVFIAFSIVSGMMASKKGGAPAPSGGPAARRSRPGGGMGPRNADADAPKGDD